MEQLSTQLVVQLSLTLAVVVLHLLLAGMRAHLITRVMHQHQANPTRCNVISKSLGLVQILLSLFLLALIWGVDMRGVWVFSAGFFGLVGIAFFAVWSILSNITAGIVLFFRFPFRIGDRVSFPEIGDVGGRIVDITLFYIVLEQDDGTRATVPNNVAIQKVTRYRRDVAAAPSGDDVTAAG
ncbi:MAG: mechanosensitive ion channel domain-containing protein [Planctomycetota bacterium]